MSCVAPPELTDRALLEHVHAEAGPEVEDHLRRCQYCRARVEEMRSLHARLAARLYRAPCPSPQELGEFHLALLSEESAAAVSEHMAECPYCAREVGQLAEYLAQPLPVPRISALGRLARGCRNLVRGLAERVSGERPTRRGPLFAVLAPAYVGVRGAEEALVYEAGDVQIAIEIQDDPQQADRLAVLGLVTGADPTGLRGFLARGEKTVAEAAVDDLGNFVLAGLASGRYDLRLSGPDLDIRVDDLQVGRE
jgi:anti-sigma factor RsiW